MLILGRGFSIHEFAYRRASHSSVGCSPFEIVYDFNPLKPLDLLSLPINKRSSLSDKKG